MQTTSPKKRKRDASEVLDIAMVADSFNKDQIIRELKKEIESNLIHATEALRQLKQLQTNTRNRNQRVHYRPTRLRLRLRCSDILPLHFLKAGSIFNSNTIQIKLINIFCANLTLQYTL